MQHVYVPQMKRRNIAARDVWVDAHGRVWLLVAYDDDGRSIREPLKPRVVMIVNDQSKEMREFAGTLNDARDRMRAAGRRRLSKRTRRTRP